MPERNPPLLEERAKNMANQPGTWSYVTIVWALAIGLVASPIVGFTWGGWTLGITAERAAASRAEAAVVAALAPGCAAGVLALPDAVARKKAFMEAHDYLLSSIFTGDAAKFATLPGQQRIDTGLANACADLIRGGKKSA